MSNDFQFGHGNSQRLKGIFLLFFSFFFLFICKITLLAVTVELVMEYNATLCLAFKFSYHQGTRIETVVGVRSSLLMWWLKAPLLYCGRAKNFESASNFSHCNLIALKEGILKLFSNSFWAFQRIKPVLVASALPNQALALLSNAIIYLLQFLQIRTNHSVLFSKGLSF